MPWAYSSIDPYISNILKKTKKTKKNHREYTKMLSKRILISLPLLLSILSSYALADPLNPQIVGRAAPPPEAAPNAETFQKLLNEVDPPALHSLLHEHSPKKFAHGMFREDRVAVEAIHRESPALAESIVSLAKRQAVTNGTAQSSPPSPAATSTTPDVLNPSASNPNQISNTARVNPLASPAVGSISSTTSAPDSASATTTTAPAPSSAVASVTQSPAKTSSSTAGQGSTITNSFGVLVVTTIGGSSRTVASVPSNQNSSSKISATTTVPARTSVTVHTSTLSNGSQSLVTQITVFGSSVLGPTPTGTAGVQESSTLAPSLQSGAAARTGSAMKAVLCLFGGALGVAVLM